MKKYISVPLAALLTSVLCISGAAEAHAEEKSAPLIVTTIFPEYDGVKTLLGDNPASAEVVLLLDNGVDLHSYQPTAEDMMNIAQSDLFIYVGGESDGWVKDALKEAVNEEMIVIDLLEEMGNLAKEEEVVEGMQEEEHDHDRGEEAGEEDHDHEEDPELDEHVWLSLKNAKVLCTVIEEALEKVDPDHAGEYQANLDTFTAQLDALDESYQEAAASAQYDTLLFGDRFPFRYLTDDYGLSYYAAFAGCSAETEASFDTIIFLADRMDELELPAILTLEGTDQRIAQTVLQTCGGEKDRKILEMDSMQSVTAKDVEEGASYLQIMEKNLEVLREALG